MADNSLTIDRNRFLALVLKSPTQMGWLSIINSVTNISRLCTFKERLFMLIHWYTTGIYIVFMQGWKKPFFYLKKNEPSYVFCGFITNMPRKEKILFF
jgi:hypothetical protein